jgi:general secretion pathway protein F
MLFLMTYVVSQTVRVLKSAEQALPFLTPFYPSAVRVPNELGMVVSARLHWCSFFMGHALANLYFIVRIDHVLLNLPLIGRLLLSFEAAPFANMMAMLIAANVAILTVLQSARDTLNNTVLRAAIDSTELHYEVLRNGQPLAKN